MKYQHTCGAIITEALCHCSVISTMDIKEIDKDGAPWFENERDRDESYDYHSCPECFEEIHPKSLKPVAIIDVIESPDIIKRKAHKKAMDKLKGGEKHA